MGNPGDGADVHPFSFYPELIEWKLKQKSKVKSIDLRISISISIIIDCACLAEGVLNTINKEIISVPLDDPNFLGYRLEQMLEEKSEKGQFSENLDIYHLVIGTNSNDLFGNELWKSIKMLSTFRNKLVHGKIIEIFNNENDGAMEVFWSYKIVYAYLLEKKLLDDRFSEDYENFLFQDKVLEHFYKSTLNFIRVIAENVPDSAKDYVREMTYSVNKRISDKKNIKLNTDNKSS